jgi:hypothetical protein
MFYDIKTGKAQTVQQAKDANRYPHVEAAWCHCRKCSNHDAYIDSLAARISAAEARLAKR